MNHIKIEKFIEKVIEMGRKNLTEEEFIAALIQLNIMLLDYAVYLVRLKEALREEIEQQQTS